MSNQFHLFQLGKLLFASFLLWGMGVHLAFGQDPCQVDKSFSAGETVYRWGKKDWNSHDHSWVQYKYLGKQDGYHRLEIAPRNTMRLENLRGVYSSREFTRLDRSKGGCAECTQAYIQRFTRESLQLLNDYRTRNGQKPLKADPVLSKAAQDFAEWKVNNLESHSQISHSADGRTVNERVIRTAKAMGVPVINDRLNGEAVFMGVGENITAGRICAPDAFESWRNSAGHNRNMLRSSYEYVGIGVACGINSRGEKIIFAVQKFGNQKLESDATSHGEVAVETPKPVISRGEQRGQFDENSYYRLTTKWQGAGKSLDVVNDGRNNQLQLANSGNYTGQMWKITSLDDGYYRLTTRWQGEGKSLDVVNDGRNNKLQLANTGNYSGQAWKITPMGGGYYRLTTAWQGTGKSLDVVNDGKNNKLQLANTGNYSGQMWKIEKIR